MKQIILLVLLFLFAGCVNQEQPLAPVTQPPLVPSPIAANSTHAAAQLYNSGMAQFNAANYTAAYGNFSAAKALFEESQDYGMAQNASYMLLRVNRALYEYPYNETQVRQLLDAAFPNATQEKKEEWLANPTSYITDQGVKWYYNALAANIYYNEPELMHERSRKAGENIFFDQLAPIAFNATSGEEQYSNPQPYETVGQLYARRDSLPANGTLALWIPVPIETDSQKNVTVVLIAPEMYVKEGPSINGDVGLIYMEIPLENMSKDLNVTVVSRFIEYEQHFSVDIAKVGEYDLESPLYQKYTASDTETAYTPEMTALAKRIVGNETNPYLMAEKLYWHVINKTTYNSAPHLSLYARGIPESFYAQKYSAGDCGTQSMYFSALCRSLGIPARSPGGYQMVPGHEGTHFWAQVYIPNYGWMPVDTTVAETADWGYNISAKDSARFKEFYFGNLDNYRLVIQNDVGEALSPPADPSLVFPIVMQTAQGSCDTAEGDISLALSNWTMVTKPVAAAAPQQ